MTAVLLALLTALCYGVANYLGPLLSRSNPLGGVLVVGQTVGLVLAGLFLALVGTEAPDRAHLLLGLLAGVFNAAALAAVYAAAAIGPMSIVVPLGATGGVVPVLVAIASGERPSALQLLGIPLAVAGVVVAAMRRRVPVPSEAGLTAEPPDGRTAARPAPVRSASTKVIGLSVFSALFFGLFLTFLGKATDPDPAWAIFTSRSSVLACTVGYLLVRRPSIRMPRAAVGRAAVPGALLLIGTAAYAEATTQGLVSVVAVLATLAPVVTVGLAVVLLGERLARRQQLGVATALIGIVLLAGG